jgi:hypothetical protein
VAKRARQSFAFSVGDMIQVVSEDDEYDDDHPFVKARPDMFVDIQDNPHRIKAPSAQPLRPPVEQATAAPGEVRRGPGRPRKTEVYRPPTPRPKK